jgi:hypothetical protein
MTLLVGSLIAVRPLVAQSPGFNFASHGSVDDRADYLIHEAPGMPVLNRRL